jgi:hypothetical protein
VAETVIPAKPGRATILHRHSFSIMGIRKRGLSFARVVGVAMLLMAGCSPAPQVLTTNKATNPDPPRETPETQSMAEAALGKQAEVLAHGDLARNGLEQILVVNRSANGNNGGEEKLSAVLITRVAILQKNNGKWSEVLLGDEHLKNPYGYLGGSPTGRVNGWRLQYALETNQGLELKFTPASAGAANPDSDEDEPAERSVVVRWNARLKRYQSMDQAHETYLNEVPLLETPQSILR